MPLSPLRAGIVLATLALAGAPVGSGAAYLLADRALPLAPRVAPLPRLDPPSRPPAAVVSAALVRPPPDPPPAPSTTTEEACDTAYRVVGSMIVLSEPARSFVAVRSAIDAMLWTAGSEVGDLRVTAIEPRAARMRRADGSECVLAMGAPSAPPASLPTAAPALVEAIGPNRFRIDPSLLTDPSALGHVRLVPEMRDGAMRGARIYGVRRGSQLARLGLRNGDIVRAIDGAPVDPSNALEAHGRLALGAPVRVTIERASAEFDVVLELAPGRGGTR